MYAQQNFLLRNKKTNSVSEKQQILALFCFTQIQQWVLTYSFHCLHSCLLVVSSFHKKRTVFIFKKAPEKKTCP